MVDTSSINWNFEPPAKEVVQLGAAGKEAQESNCMNISPQT